MTTLTLTEIEEGLKTYIVQGAEERGVTLEDLGRDDDFIESQVFDSLSLLDFVQHVERVVGAKIPGEDVVPENFGSLSAIVGYLQRSFGLS